MARSAGETRGALGMRGGNPAQWDAPAKKTRRIARAACSTPQLSQVFLGRGDWWPCASLLAMRVAGAIWGITAFYAALFHASSAAQMRASTSSSPDAHITRAGAEHAIAEAPKVPIPASIGGTPQRMLRAIHFDDQAMRRDDEVRNEATEHLRHRRARRDSRAGMRSPPDNPGRSDGESRLRVAARHPTNARRVLSGPALPRHIMPPRVRQRNRML